jgi:hypothetical protein
MIHFVGEYDHETHKMISMTQYDEQPDAQRRYSELKQLNATNVDVLLMSATSLDDLRAAHPQYFSWVAPC